MENEILNQIFMKNIKIISYTSETFLRKEEEKEKEEEEDCPKEKKTRWNPEEEESQAEAESKIENEEFDDEDEYENSVTLTKEEEKKENVEEEEENEKKNTEKSFQMFINFEMILDVIASCPAKQVGDNLTLLANQLIETIQNIIEIIEITNGKFQLNVIINKNILSSLSWIQHFFQQFSSQIPIDSIFEINVYALAKYTGIAKLLLTFADRKVKRKMKISSISKNAHFP